MNEAKISFRCPGCGELIGFPGIEAGTVQDCPECGGWVDVPELIRSATLAEPYQKENERLWGDASRQSAEQDRLIEMSRTNHDEWRRQLEQSARYQDQAEEAFRRFAALVGRCEGLADRFERMLKQHEQTSGS